MVDDAVAFVAALLWLTTAVESANVLRRRHPEPALNMLLVTFGLLAIIGDVLRPRDAPRRGPSHRGRQHRGTDRPDGAVSMREAK